MLSQSNSVQIPRQISEEPVVRVVREHREAILAPHEKPGKQCIMCMDFSPPHQTKPTKGCRIGLFWGTSPESYDRRQQIAATLPIALDRSFCRKDFRDGVQNISGEVSPTRSSGRSAPYLPGKLKGDHAANNRLVASRYALRNIVRAVDGEVLTLVNV